MLSTYLGYFSGSFGISLVFWPLTSLILTLPILALIYNRYHKLLLSSALTAYLVVLYFLALVFFTLWPMPDDRAAFCATHHLSPQLDPLRFLADLSMGGRMALFQILLNVAFFIPLGFIMGRVFRWRLRIALPVGFAVSLFIETAQLTGVFGLVGCAYRLFDVDDLVWNTSGALIGYLIALTVNHFLPSRRTEAAELVTRPGFLHRCVSLAVDLVLTYVLSMSLGLGLTYLIHKLASYHLDGSYQLGPLVVNPANLNIMVMVLDVLLLLFFELFIPLFRQGKTLGATFTHMTIETRTRRGLPRFFFYMLRTLMIVLIFGPWTGTVRQYANLLAILLVIFYILKRQMPYDLLPGEAILPDPKTNESHSDPSPEGFHGFDQK